ncbi:CopD family protein [Algimonas porphyrae]|uniref:Protoporphyrinogen IX oxidase n=1 Tax=Algimonas porphyrae TaxID=1128113 RepID=A0ABQ5V1J4_9PROT|nr:CopD family protein [Algimonas porphyrae]GLQ20549.1 membrane protein [Algimonas porphyrae]
MTEPYLWIKAFHLTAVIFWMAGMLYLPRLFVYHSVAIAGGELETKMEEAEAKLLRIIVNPAMIVAFLLGLVLLGYNMPPPLWLLVKVALAFSLIGFHAFLAKTRKQFLNGGRPRSEKFFRRINEIPALVTIVIVVLAIVKPVF